MDLITMPSSLVEKLKQDIALHTSDFFPFGTQLHALQSEIEALEQALRSLDSRTSTSAVRSEKLCALRLALSNSCTVKKALFAPVRKLPSEILGEIFVWCLPDLTDASVIYNSTTPESAPLLLVRVCKRWERVAVNTPQLWCKLGLHGVRGSNPHVLISTWLSRSGSLPIDIYINPLSWHDSIYSKSFKTSIIPRAMQTLAAEFHRCRTFRCSNFPALLEGLFPDGNNTYAPLLRDFQITPSPKACGYLLTGNITAPKLETIDVCDPRQTLLSITTNYQNLRNVRWNGSSVYNPRDSSLDHLASLLRSCPNLEECEIVRPTAEDTFFDVRTKVHLPYLHRLSLVWKCTVELGGFLSLLDLPVLESLRLEIDPTRLARPTLEQTLDALFPSTNPPPQLKELHVVHLDIIKHGESSGASQFVPPLIFPSLESLRFDDCTLPITFLESLTPGSDQPLDSWKIPKLSSLHLSNVEFDGAHLVRMIENRLPNSVSRPSPLKLVSLVNCRGLSQADETALRALVEVHDEFVVQGVEDVDCRKPDTSNATYSSGLILQS